MHPVFQVLHGTQTTYCLWRERNGQGYSRKLDRKLGLASASQQLANKPPKVPQPRKQQIAQGENATNSETKFISMHCKEQKEAKRPDEFEENVIRIYTTLFYGDTRVFSVPLGPERGYAINGPEFPENSFVSNVLQC
ncbi:hypothetical protein SARC_06599 [Sphaeroforma arctica JP610]|uniref:Uncharacterized protein n=1 Tax=Sphaeroforma arctica JP610 TaxID=667725 RepID=A0A0L0FW50_9EUKA|nr:hypothetical protein SARC_06599 [Sphaeroforma arctica JP610]KNC81057.1 hypothetical protein SARC_06599 [Sphaeroforma arctica JP610]|eukprot:XP_014154959.1 hypothetical protein SARC_06599 [Sphaeroforma arctica JP610]